MRDVFICHAGKDKEDYVRPFIASLQARAVTYWIDEAEIHWGERISRKINEGLSLSRFVIVFLTEAFLDKNWPQAELESALNLEITKGDVVVLPILAASEETVFKQYPLLRDKLFFRWEEGADVIATKLSVMLGREFKNHWVHCHPVDYSGNIWIRVLAKPENVNAVHEYLIRWGPWEKKGYFSFGRRQCLSLKHTKGVDKLSLPIFFTISPECYVSFGQDDPPDEHSIDINFGWRRVE